MTSTQIYFFVVFGSPGTGKTTLLSQLREYKGWVRFLTLDEPTRGPNVAPLLEQMYKETPADIAAGKSVAAQVQTLIMETRAAGYKELMTHQGFDIGAKPSGTEPIVIVCDGHLLTDDKLYVRSKFDGGQISTAQLCEYEDKKRQLLDSLPALCRKPGVFCQLTVGADESGVKHHHRVCKLRKDKTEEDVDPAVFARLARYADEAADQLERDHSQPVHRFNTDGRTPTQVRDDFIQFVNSRISEK